MYYITKSFEVSCALKLYLGYESDATYFHGHNYTIEITCGASKLNKNGMVVDFDEVENEVISSLDHKCLNDIFRADNPTSENIAKWICDQVDILCETGYCIRVSITESQGNIAIYENDEGSTNLAAASLAIN